MPDSPSQSTPASVARPALQVEAALLRFPTPTGRRWLRFGAPTKSILAWTLDEVRDALNAVEAAVDAGSWAVGMISFDAAPAFDPALVALRNERVPLVAFGVFDEPARSRGPAGAAFELTDWSRSRTRSRYEADVASLKRPIAAGETYQVNYTMRLRSQFTGDPLGLFEALSRAQRAEHLAFLQLGEAAVCSASPELFVRREGSTVISRPMKGTRPRHPDPDEDRQLIDDLVRSAKDRAENTMIVDMTRNDLGRIAEIGSLRVPALHAVETYPTVHQLTSTVTAETSDSLFDLLAATFPGASITGAPKVSTCRIIADTEKEPRGIYTGSIGALSPDGTTEFNIAIRTVWLDLTEGTAEYGVGGGIVWDSDPAAEWVEALDKARILNRTRTDLRLIESIGWEPRAGATLLQQHLDRLRSSAEHFGFDLDIEEVRRLIDTVDSDVPTKLRVLVDSDGAIEMEAQPLVPLGETPLTLPLDSLPIDTGNEFLYFKTTVRDRYDDAQARFPEAVDVVLWNTRGELTETTRGNLVVELEGELLTPPRSSGLLPGTFRAELLDQGAISEAPVRIDDLGAATQVFMVNSVRGWVPIRIDPSTIPAGHTLGADRARSEWP